MQDQSHRSDAHSASVSPAILSGIPIVYGHMRRTPLMLLVTVAALLTLPGTAGAITLDEYSVGISADGPRAACRTAQRSTRPNAAPAKRETGFEPATFCVGGRRSTN